MEPSKNRVLASRSKGAGQRRERGQAINSVARALDILDCLAAHRREVGVTEVSQELGVHKSTVSRVLATMESRGYVSRNGTSGKYCLGMRLVELASYRLEQIDLRSQARPFLEELVQATGETAHLAVFDHGKVVYVDKVDTPQTLMMRSKIGYRVFAHCTALGKAILATLPDELVEQVINEKGLPRFTPNTIVDPLALKEHLRRVRAQGYAVDDEEHEEGIRCAAAAILDHAGRVVGALSVSGPTLRVSRQDVETIANLVRDSARRLSVSLGYHAPATEGSGR
ncbi:MAG: IclR family transcriptional regulator [Bacteroidota bacterium]